MLVSGSRALDASAAFADVLDALGNELPVWGTSAGALFAFVYTSAPDRLPLVALQWRRLRQQYLLGDYSERCRLFVRALVGSCMDNDEDAELALASSRLRIVAFNCSEMRPRLFSNRCSPEVPIATALFAAIVHPLLHVPCLLDDAFYCSVEFLIPARVLELALRPRCLAVLQCADRGADEIMEWVTVHPTLHTVDVIGSFFNRILERHCRSAAPVVGDSSSGALIVVVIVFGTLLRALLQSEEDLPPDSRIAQKYGGVGRDLLTEASA